MCSQECMAKMKILCLNTVQVLFKDAFDKFANNMISGGSPDLTKLLDENRLSAGMADSKSRSIDTHSDRSALSACKDHQPVDCCQRASTSFNDPNCSFDECPAVNDNDQNCQNQLNNRLVSQFKGQQTNLPGQETNQQTIQQIGQPTGQQSSQVTNQPADRRSLSQLVLCNLMKNLVDAVNEQCVKQLPDLVKVEKKKRKRKRKRKKLKTIEM